MALVREFFEAMGIECRGKDRFLFMHFLHFFSRASDGQKKKLLMFIAAEEQGLKLAELLELDIDFAREMHQRFVVDLQGLRNRTGMIPAIKG